MGKAIFPLPSFSQQCKGSALLQESHLLMPPQLPWQSSETMKSSIPEWGRKEGRGEGRVSICARSQHSSTREGTAIRTSLSPKPEPGTLHPVACPIFKAKREAGLPSTPAFHSNAQWLSATCSFQQVSSLIKLYNMVISSQGLRHNSHEYYIPCAL